MHDLSSFPRVYHVQGALDLGFLVILDAEDGINLIMMKKMGCTDCLKLIRAHPLESGCVVNSTVNFWQGVQGLVEKGRERGILLFLNRSTFQEITIED